MKRRCMAPTSMLLVSDNDKTSEGEVPGWHLDAIPSCRLRPFLKRLNLRIPGVTNGMLSFGAPRAFFAWHVEDANLYSVNYLHCGAPKSWYALDPRAAPRFEEKCTPNPIWRGVPGLS